MDNYHEISEHCSNIREITRLRSVVRNLQFTIERNELLIENMKGYIYCNIPYNEADEPPIANHPSVFLL